MRELSAEDATGTTKIIRCPYVIPKSEWLREIQLVGKYVATVESIWDQGREPELVTVFEATAEISNAEDDIPPAMRDVNTTPLPRFSLREEQTNMQDSGLGAQMSEMSERMFELQLASTPTAMSIYDRQNTSSPYIRPEDIQGPSTCRYSRGESVSRRPGNINQELQEDRFPVLKTHRERESEVEAFIKKARREQELAEAREKEHNRSQAIWSEQLLQYYRKRCIEQAQQAAGIMHPRTLQEGLGGIMVRTTCWVRDFARTKTNMALINENLCFCGYFLVC